MKLLEKINFRQPKYMLPAILYLPILATAYFVVDLFHTETAGIQDRSLQTTEYLNPELPEAQIKGGDGIGTKYENMAKSWGRIQDHSAIDNIEREEPDNAFEEYESKYTEDDLALLDGQGQEKETAAQAADARTREEEALAELEKALAEARLKAQQEMQMTPPDTAGMEQEPTPAAEIRGRIAEDSRSVSALSESDRTNEVVRRVKTPSDYFNTLAQNEPEPKLIKAIIDENITAVDGGAVTTNMNMATGSYGNSLSQWGMQAAQNAYQQTSNAIGKAIKKNKARLKYGTFVYLVNGRETRNR